MTVDSFQPLNERLLLEVIPDAVQKYEGAIQVVDYSQEKSNIAIVIKLPLGYTGGANNLKVGDKVMFNRHAGSALKFDTFSKDATEYRLIKESDLLGILND